MAWLQWCLTLVHVSDRSRLVSLYMDEAENMFFGDVLGCFYLQKWEHASTKCSWS